MEMEMEMERELCSFVQNHDLDSFIQHYESNVNRFYAVCHCKGDWFDGEGAFLCDAVNKLHMAFVLTLIRFCIFFRNTKAFEVIMSSEYSIGIYNRQKMDEDIREETVQCVNDILFGVLAFREPTVKHLINGPAETYTETILFVLRQDNFKYVICFLDSVMWGPNKLDRNDCVGVVHRLFLEHDLITVPDIRYQFLR